MAPAITIEDDHRSMCPVPGCTESATLCRTHWPSPGHMRIDYYCARHAPPDAEPIEEDVRCRKCGEPVCVNDDGTANHVFDIDHPDYSDIDFDRDRDHVPIPDNVEPL